jgi:hypothetical protein
MFLQGAIRLILVELFAGSCPMSCIVRLRGTLRELLNADVELVANVIAELNGDVVAAAGLDPCQVGVQLKLKEDNCCFLVGEEARIGTPEVDGGIVNWVVERMWRADGGRAADAVLIVGGPPCQPHSDMRASNVPSEEELDESMHTVEAFCMIATKIKAAAEPMGRQQTTLVAAAGVAGAVGNGGRDGGREVGSGSRECSNGGGSSDSNSEGPLVFFVMENPLGKHPFAMRKCIARSPSCSQLLAGLGAALPTWHQWSEYATNMPRKDTSVWSNVFTQPCMGRQGICYRASTVRDLNTGWYLERYTSAANGRKLKRQRQGDFLPSRQGRVKEAYERSKWPDGFCLAVLKRVIAGARERWPTCGHGS